MSPSSRIRFVVQLCNESLFLVGDFHQVLLVGCSRSVVDRQGIGSVNILARKKSKAP